MFAASMDFCKVNLPKMSSFLFINCKEIICKITVHIQNWNLCNFQAYTFDNPNNHCAQCASSWVKQKHHDLAFGNQKRFVALLVQSTGNFLQNSDLKPTIQLQLNSVRAPKDQLISKANFLVLSWTKKNEIIFWFLP